MQLGEGELGCPVHGDEQVELALVGPDLGNIDVEVADGIALERLFGGLVAGDLGQAADAVALQTAVKRRPGQVRERRLECIEAVVQRQQGMPAEGDDNGLFLRTQNRRTNRLRSHRRVLNERPLAPFGDGLVIEPVPRR